MGLVCGNMHLHIVCLLGVRLWPLLCLRLGISLAEGFWVQVVFLAWFKLLIEPNCLLLPCPHKVRIYSDCLGVVNRYHLITLGRAKLKLNTANADLWQWILESVDRLCVQSIQLCKVPAHRRLSSAKTQREAWLFWNNGAADQVAKYTNISRPPSFWEFWQQYVSEVHAAEALHLQACRLHVAVAQRSVKSAAEGTLDEETVQIPRPTRAFQETFDIQGWRGDIPHSLALEYGVGMMRRLTTWWTERSVRATGETVRWISFAHLYVDYHLTSSRLRVASYMGM
eukprot:s462_g82.t1